jgi:hypothetical protein
MSTPDPAGGALRLPSNVKLTPVETARYTRDLIESLRKIAGQQGHSLLAHLLELAAIEAKALAEGDYAQETRLPE